jgi:hypothetical protein
MNYTENQYSLFAVIHSLASVHRTASLLQWVNHVSYQLVNCTIEKIDSDSGKLRKFFIAIFEHLNSKNSISKNNYRKSDIENFFELVHTLHFVVFIHINFSLMWLRQIFFLDSSGFAMTPQFTTNFKKQVNGTLKIQ